MNLRRYVGLCIASVFILLLVSCATTTDPRKGGLFGYNPAAYKKRLAEREEELSKLKRDQQLLKQKSKQLEEEAAQRRSEGELLEQKITVLDGDIARLNGLISSIKIQSREQEKKLSQINAKLKTVREDLTRAKSGSSSEIEARKKEITRLNQRIDELLREAEALSEL